MPDQPQCISPSPPGSPAEPPAAPPVLDPAKWEDFPTFRETFLMYFTEPPANSALRIFGRLFHELVLEYYHHWPNWPEGVTLTELRAPLSPISAIWKGTWEPWGGSMRKRASRRRRPPLSQLAARRLAGELARIAGEIEQALGGRA
jgi:hypothetical protein